MRPQCVPTELCNLWITSGYFRWISCFLLIELLDVEFIWFQEQVEKLKALHVDSAEYSCLKAIVLFTTGESIHIYNVDSALLIAWPYRRLMMLRVFAIRFSNIRGGRPKKNFIPTILCLHPRLQFRLRLFRFRRTSILRWHHLFLQISG